MLNQKIVVSGFFFLVIIFYSYFFSQNKIVYADDIASLLNQATAACSQAESTAGQSFGCTDFGQLYSSMNNANQMSNQMQNFESTLSTGMSVLNNLFGSMFQGVEQKMGQTVNQEIQKAYADPQVQRAIYQQKQREVYDSYALGRAGVGTGMGFAPKSRYASKVPYQVSPYHSQRNPVYENPGPPSYNDSNRNQHPDGQKRGGTAFFGLGGNSHSPLDSDPNVVDLRNQAVPAVLDQMPVQGRQLVQKNQNSFDFDGTGQGDNRVSFKRPFSNKNQNYDVSAGQAQTWKSNADNFMKQSNTYATKLFERWNEDFFKPLQKKYFLPQEQKPISLDSAIERNLADEKLMGKKKCNFYAASIGKNMGVPYFMSYPKKVDEANRIYNFIQYAVGDPKTSGWREITPEEAQKRANKGKFVIAVAKSKPGYPNGHIAVVAPKPMSRDQTTDDSQLPWVRDNNHPESSVRANWAFKSLRNNKAEAAKADTEEPIWAVWEGP